MLSHSPGFMGNISVRAKLLYGFSLLVVMMFLIAYTGWSAIDSLRDRSERMEDISSISLLTRDMRIERLVYSLTASQAQAAKWLDAIDTLDNKLKSITPHFDSPTNKELLQEVATTLVGYRQFYTQAVTATSEREAARNAATSLAEMTGKLLEELSENANGDSGSFVARQQMTQALLAFQRMRVSFRSYTASPSQESLDAVRRTMDDMVNQVNGLTSTSLPQDKVENLNSALSDYKKHLQTVASMQARADEAQTGITRSIASLFAVTDKMTSIQQASRVTDIASAFQMLMLWMTLALVTSALAGWLISRSIVAPLKETVRIAEEVANGDFTYQAVVSRRDELGMLQDSMQRMTAGLRALIGDVKDGIVQVASAAEELSAVTEQTSAGVNAQTVETDQIATAMHEMTATSQEVSRNAAQASRTALEASQKALQGDEVVTKAVSQIELLAAEMETTKMAMTSLRTDAESIGGVLDVIKAVAEQTNLLALNAAIEAARAGEAGRGFAVVADEVRGLAQRTRTSTDEIAHLISGLHSSTDRMAGVLEQNILVTDSSVSLSREAGAALRSITDSIRTIESMNEQIACAVEQQTSAGEEISRSVTSVRDISVQTAAASEETASSSVELARISARLQEMTNRFKV
ncbi:methyl-accepting chemotaxis protein [Pseudomonas flavescens]|uniref:Methyl-accepting chemotaxis protein n=1 Tax=Phytopseudomonas flavescens TaxID=29435 RepID=A0A1G8KUU2_9GAMM|nr:methyl-accepting chemotaxis protein [Pseudomonas flavescens]SDI47152.1 methyl-accepting chemotaxis protein [Pseudomonas flavescens]